MNLTQTLFVAIIGGISVYYVPKLIKKIITSRTPVLVYQFDDCGDESKYEIKRRIHHSFGEIVEDKDASNGKAWKHTSNRIKAGHTTCYGPYSKEIPFRGKYKAVFRIKVCGIKDKRASLVVLDVTYGESSSESFAVTLGLPLVEKVLKGDDFVEEKYRNYKVEFDYDGQSLVEFRCAVENPENFENRVGNIYFDNVKIYPVIDIW